MPEQRTCDYTGEDIEPGTGIMYVRRDGTILHFKDAKAEKNFFMGREAADLEWTGPKTTDADAGDTETAETDSEDADGTDSEDADGTDSEVEAEVAEGEQE